jgi:hypothetical protein
MFLILKRLFAAAPNILVSIVIVFKFNSALLNSSELPTLKSRIKAESCAYDEEIMSMSTKLVLCISKDLTEALLLVFFIIDDSFVKVIF